MTPKSEEEEEKNNRVCTLVKALLTDIHKHLQESRNRNGKQLKPNVHAFAQKQRQLTCGEIRKKTKLLQDQILETGRILLSELRQKDKLLSENKSHCDVITAYIQALSNKSKEEAKMRFALAPGETGFSQWLDAMKMVAQLPGGMPPEFRTKLWLQLSEKHFQDKNIDWPRVEKQVFSEWSNPDDEELGVQIVKDLHRTGCSLFCGAQGEQNQALLKRVLLAYARWNKSVGYCQGFNMLAALILQVMDRDEKNAVKVMIYLIDSVLPESYFANNLRGLSVDMAVFRDLMKTRLPKLSRHLDALQQDTSSGNNYEPPLTNVFTMQWFLTLFSNCLPQPTVLRVWDLVFLYGNEVLLRTALAIWGILQDRVISVESADEFYSIMGVVTREMLEFGLMDANNLIKTIVMVDPFHSELQELRDKYLYNISPWTQSVQTAAKRGFRLFHSDNEDQDDTEDEATAKALATAYGVFRRRESASKDVTPAGPTLDIGVLKQQYAKLLQRQRQAHVIISAACTGSVGSSSVSVNQLLAGKSALIGKGRRIGPPEGSVPPPAPHLRTGKKTKVPISGETLHWKDVSEVSEEKNLPAIQDNAATKTKRLSVGELRLRTNHDRNEGSRSRVTEKSVDESFKKKEQKKRSSSSSSSSTELCDDEFHRYSDIDSEEASEGSGHHTEDLMPATSPKINSDKFDEQFSESIRDVETLTENIDRDDRNAEDFARVRQCALELVNDIENKLQTCKRLKDITKLQSSCLLKNERLRNDDLPDVLTEKMPSKSCPKSLDSGLSNDTISPLENVSRFEHSPSRERKLMDEEALRYNSDAISAQTEHEEKCNLYDSNTLEVKHSVYISRHKHSETFNAAPELKTAELFPKTSQVPVSTLDSMPFFNAKPDDLNSKQMLEPKVTENDNVVNNETSTKTKIKTIRFSTHTENSEKPLTGEKTPIKDNEINEPETGALLEKIELKSESSSLLLGFTAASKTQTRFDEETMAVPKIKECSPSSEASSHVSEIQATEIIKKRSSDTKSGVVDTEHDAEKSLKNEETRDEKDEKRKEIDNYRKSNENTVSPSFDCSGNELLARKTELEQEFHRDLDHILIRTSVARSEKISNDRDSDSTLKKEHKESISAHGKLHQSKESQSSDHLATELLFNKTEPVELSSGQMLRNYSTVQESDAKIYLVKNCPNFDKPHTKEGEGKNLQKENPHENEEHKVSNHYSSEFLYNKTEEDQCFQADSGHVSRKGSWNKGSEVIQKTLDLEKLPKKGHEQVEDGTLLHNTSNINFEETFPGKNEIKDQSILTKKAENIPLAFGNSAKEELKEELKEWNEPTHLSNEVSPKPTEVTDNFQKKETPCKTDVSSSIHSERLGEEQKVRTEAMSMDETSNAGANTVHVEMEVKQQIKKEDQVPWEEESDTCTAGKRGLSSEEKDIPKSNSNELTHQILHIISESSPMESLNVTGNASKNEEAHIKLLARHAQVNPDGICSKAEPTLEYNYSVSPGQGIIEKELTLRERKTENKSKLESFKELESEINDQISLMKSYKERSNWQQKMPILSPLEEKKSTQSAEANRAGSPLLNSVSKQTQYLIDNNKPNVPEIAGEENDERKGKQEICTKKMYSPGREEAARRKKEDIFQKLESSKQQWENKMQRIAELDSTTRAKLSELRTDRREGSRFRGRSISPSISRTTVDPSVVRSDRKLRVSTLSFDEISSRTEKLLRESSVKSPEAKRPTNLGLPLSRVPIEISVLNDTSPARDVSYCLSSDVTSSRSEFSPIGSQDSKQQRNFSPSPTYVKPKNTTSKFKQLLEECYGSNDEELELGKVPLKRYQAYSSPTSPDAQFKAKIKYSEFVSPRRYFYQKRRSFAMDEEDDYITITSEGSDTNINFSVSGSGLFPRKAPEAAKKLSPSFSEVSFRAEPEYEKRTRLMPGADEDYFRNYSRDEKSPSRERTSPYRYQVQSPPKCLSRASSSPGRSILTPEDLGETSSLLRLDQCNFYKQHSSTSQGSSLTELRYSPSKLCRSGIDDLDKKSACDRSNKLDDFFASNQRQSTSPTTYSDNALSVGSVRDTSYKMIYYPKEDKWRLEREEPVLESSQTKIDSSPKKYKDDNIRDYRCNISSLGQNRSFLQQGEIRESSEAGDFQPEKSPKRRRTPLSDDEATTFRESRMRSEETISSQSSSSWETEKYRRQTNFSPFPPRSPQKPKDITIKLGLYPSAEKSTKSGFGSSLS